MTLHTPAWAKSSKPHHYYDSMASPICVGDAAVSAIQRICGLPSFLATTVTYHKAWAFLITQSKSIM